MIKCAGSQFFQKPDVCETEPAASRGLEGVGAPERTEGDLGAPLRRRCSGAVFSSSEFRGLPQLVRPGEPQWKRNKLVQIVNGNRASKGIKMAHWNLGSAELQNKMCEIEAVVGQIKPGIFGISEANLSRSTDLSKVQLNGYKLLTAKTLQNPSIEMSRVVVYLSENLVGKLREDLMSDNFLSI